MLQELHIKNFALVDEIHIEFSRELNVLTGETGAGKSIILNSLNLLLGERVSSDMIRKGQDAGMVEASFDIGRFPHIAAALTGTGIETAQDELLVIKRDLSREGKSRCYINGSLVNLSTLKGVGDLLVDIHGQHDHQSLLHTEQHMKFLDSFGTLDDACRNVASRFQAYRELLQEKERLGLDDEALSQRLNLYRFQIEEIEKARLNPAEEAELEEEHRLLSHAEYLYETLSRICRELDEDNFSVTERLGQINRELERAVGVDSTLGGVVEAAGAAHVQLQEASNLLSDYLAKLPDHNPERLREIEERLSLLESLKRKYGKSLGELCEYHKAITREVEELSNIEEIRDRLEEDIRSAEQKLSVTAAALSKKRKHAANEMTTRVERELSQLGMGGVSFVIDIAPSQLSGKGSDQVEFMISANPGEEPKPLRKIASGGEISRVMLALKHILAEVDLMPTLVFDEIDVNIGGETARTVGKKLATIAGTRQVICITHLPPIASRAAQHYFVSKRVSGGRTTVQIKKLAAQEREQEIARMLGGKEISKVVLEHAKELLKQK